MGTILSCSLSNICSNLHLAEDKADLYIVINEAQMAVNMYLACFMSQDFKTMCPILHKLITNWAKAIPDTQTQAFVATCIITGTGLNMGLIRNALSLTMCKSDKVYRVAHSGIFDTISSQCNYVLPFLPPDLAKTVSGSVLLERMFYWLHGRHCFTAEFVMMLLQADFHNPHILLSDYIKHVTGFYLTNAPAKFAIRESLPNLEFSTEALKVDQITDNMLLMLKVREACHDYALHTIVPQYIGVTKDIDLVQHGLAWFKTRLMVEVHTGKTKYEYFVTVDEPLVLLACSAYLNNVCGSRAKPGNDYSLHGQVMKDIKVHYPHNGRNGFKDVIATYFAMEFADPVPLSSIFNSVSPKYCRAELLCCKAQLMAFHRSHANGKNIDSWGTFDIRPGHEQELAGCLGSSNTRSLDSIDAQSAPPSWLCFEGRHAFCFPSNLMGPNILFLLKLTKDNDSDYFSFIWVTVQCKNHNSYRCLPDGALIDAVKMTTPNRFFILHNQNVNTASASQKRNRLEVLDALSKLPNKEPLAGVDLPEIYSNREHQLQELLEQACIAYYRNQNGIEDGFKSEGEELEDADVNSCGDAVIADAGSVFTDDAMGVDGDSSLTSDSSQDDKEMPDTNRKRRTAPVQLRALKRTKLGSR
ncbi:hypothetical protein Moror_13729 [Moniliophthora roreri MCA 2997]|uniref:Uncharacterized protein n=1 Tax=Moniliophthora roreri (strain MCA 2997) TaxID=1381753 RepID=V2XC06_MONRO|nr:hypothetical protein Moror_13729 [Moniliophthora roreri MCA 2997]